MKKPNKKETQKSNKQVLKMYDASGLVLGRLASIVAKELINGAKVDIYNAENAVVTGDPKVVFERYMSRLRYRAKGKPTNGPKYPKLPQMILKKAIKRMLPITARGRVAMDNLKVYISNADNKKLTTVEVAKLKQGLKYMKLGDLSKKMGAKW